MGACELIRQIWAATLLRAKTRSAEEQLVSGVGFGVSAVTVAAAATMKEVGVLGHLVRRTGGGVPPVGWGVRSVGGPLTPGQSACLAAPPPGRRA